MEFPPLRMNMVNSTRNLKISPVAISGVSVKNFSQDLKIDFKIRRLNNFTW
jgi:hypothetical protein